MAPGNDEFQQGIRRAVPLGWLFKGFPLHQSHLGVEQTMEALVHEPQVSMQFVPQPQPQCPCPRCA